MFESKVREIRQLAVSLPERLAEPTSAPGKEREGHPGDQSTDRAPSTARRREPDAVPHKFEPIPTSVEIENDLLKTVEEATRNGTESLAVRSTWNLVEDAIRSFAERNGANPKATVVTMLLELKRNGLLSLEEYQLLRQLYELRKMAMTTVRFTHETLLDYVVAASEILRKTGLSAQPGRSADLRTVSLGVRLED